MKSRNENLLSIRPSINSNNSESSNIENFQNSVLRPILKFQNELLIAVFKNYIERFKNQFYELTIDQKLNYIDNAIQKNTKFRNTLKGIVLGMFSVDEYLIYTTNASEINKRINQMISERIKDQLQLFNR